MKGTVVKYCVAFLSTLYLQGISSFSPSSKLHLNRITTGLNRKSPYFPPNSAICDRNIKRFGSSLYSSLKEENIIVDDQDRTAAVESDEIADSSFAFQAIILLNLVAIIWGTQHSVIKIVVDDCDPASFSFARFALATTLVVPFTPGINRFWQTDNREMTNEDLEQESLAWKWGIEMGLWMFLGYAFQAVGLEYTTAQRSGFLLYLNVKFVPFFARILFGRKISIPTWMSALTALAGTALLSYDGSALALNIGDLWSVAAAAASAMFILRLESATAAVENSAALNATSLWMVSITAALWCIGKNIREMNIPASPETLLDTGNILSSSVQATASSVLNTVVSHPIELIYLGGITTALANYIQTKAQKSISAERASIIYALDPVYGAVFANVLLGEELTELGIIGAGLITVAAATNAFLDFGGEEKDEDRR